MFFLLVNFLHTMTPPPTTTQVVETIVSAIQFKIYITTELPIIIYPLIYISVLSCAELIRLARSVVIDRTGQHSSSITASHTAAHADAWNPSSNAEGVIHPHPKHKISVPILLLPLVSRNNRAEPINAGSCSMAASMDFLHLSQCSQVEERI
jgi:hypothetical protein